MRRLLIALFLVGIAVLVAWFLARRDATGPVAPNVPVAAKDPAPTDVLEAQSTDSRHAASRSAADVGPAARTPDAAVTPKRDCIVFGRVIDPDGHPVAHTGVRLVATGRWSDDFEPPSIERSGRQQHAIEVESDMDGRFRLEVPLPTAEYVSLVVDPDAFHGYAQRGFGAIADRNEPRLVRGDNDVGDIVIAATGAIRGHVTDQKGNPIAATVLSFSGAQRSFAPQTTTAEGTYDLGHVLPGTWVLTLNASGWLQAKLEHVEVRSGATTEDVDFRLEPAPAISGVVVDKQGSPLADVRIEGRPVGGGRTTFTRSDPSGAFTMFLPQAAPHCLYLSDQPQFEAWDGGADSTFPPGTKDVRIVLTRVLSTTFRVVDSQSGKPIELYGIAVEPPLSSRSLRTSDGRSVPQREAHPNGEATLPGQPDQASVRVVARMHAPMEAPVKWDGPDQPVQTIRLLPAGSLVGQVMFAGRPAARAKITLEQDHEPPQRGVPVSRLTWFTGREQRGVADEEGRFRYEELAAGTYQLTIDSGVAARRVQHGVQVEVGATKDLGAIVLDVGATIRVHVKLAPGVDGSGLRVFLGEHLDRKADVPDTDGALVLNGVEPGTHLLTLQAHAPAVPGPMKQTVDIAAGETRDVEFDLTPHEPCNVTAHVTQNGEAARWIRVRCQLIANGRPTKEIDVGTTNDEGMATGPCPGDSAVRFVAVAEKGVLLGGSPLITLPHGGTFELQLPLSTGTLTVLLPPSVTVPASGRVVVSLTPAQGSDAGAIELRAETKSAPGRASTSFDWTGTTIDFGDVAAGEYEAVVKVHRFEKRPGAEENVWVQTDVRPEYKKHVVVEASGHTSIEIP